MASDDRNQVMRLQFGLLHAELDRRDGRGMPHRFVPALVQLYEVDQHVEFTAFRAAGLGVHEFVDSRQHGLVLGLGPNEHGRRQPPDGPSPRTWARSSDAVAHSMIQSPTRPSRSGSVTPARAAASISPAAASNFRAA